ncbi:MAG: putative post-translocation molecular chaperone [Dehalococcoidales bacterium]|nr:putative post-translocation molecular chaperone [Dehalococcoidales bacterium]
MSQVRKKITDSGLAGKPPTPKVADTSKRGRRTGFVIAAVILAVILLVVGIFYYQTYVAPFQRTLISVGNLSIKMDYFLKRAKLAGADPMAMVESLTNEQLIKLGAVQYGIAATTEEINQALRITASGGSGNITESEFKEWYRQQLNETGLSDAEYRDIAGTGLSAIGLQVYLAARVPTVAEQIHLQAIVVKTLADADKVRASIKGGESFASLARQMSVDNETAEKGGEIGWFPRGILPAELDTVAFSLKAGEVSESIPYTESSDPSAPQTMYFVLMVSEKANARQVDEDFLAALKDKALADWLEQEKTNQNIRYYNFDSVTYAWMNLQLAKSKAGGQQ